MAEFSAILNFASLQQRYIDRLEKSSSTSLIGVWLIQVCSVYTTIVSARVGDPQARQISDFTAKSIGLVLLTVNLSDPQFSQ